MIYLFMLHNLVRWQVSFMKKQPVVGLSLGHYKLKYDIFVYVAQIPSISQP